MWRMATRLDNVDQREGFAIFLGGDTIFAGKQKATQLQYQKG